MSERSSDSGKMSRLDHILITPKLLHAVQTVEHVKVGRDNSDPAAVLMYLHWSHSNVGKGVFWCGPNTHKDLNYQKVLELPLHKIC